MIKQPITRRNWMQRTAAGLKAAALTSIFSGELYGEQAQNRVKYRGPLGQQQRAAQRDAPAQSVIHLFMNGGPSQMDLFDPKPELSKRHGESYFNELASEVESPAAAGALMKTPYRFAQHGEAGHWISNVLPHLSTCADDLAVIKSMYTTNLTHEPALFKIHGGQY